MHKHTYCELSVVYVYIVHAPFIDPFIIKNSSTSQFKVFSIVYSDPAKRDPGTFYIHFFSPTYFNLISNAQLLSL